MTNIDIIVYIMSLTHHPVPRQVLVHYELNLVLKHILVLVCRGDKDRGV